MSAEKNMACARAAFENFTPLEPAWVANLHPDIVMEFPYGEDIGLPPRVEGKDQCAGLFQLVFTKLGLVFFDVEVSGMADPDGVLVECRGKGAFGDVIYNQTYVIRLGFRDGKVILYREYFNTKVVVDAFGHLSALM